MTLRPYMYSIHTRAGQVRNGVNVISNAGLLSWNSRGYRQTVPLYRTTREQTTNQLLTGSRAVLNAGFRNSGNLVCIKFEKSGWSFSVYKDGGFWVNGFKKPKKDVDLIFGYMASRHNRDITYDEAEEMFLNVISTDLEISQTFVNKLSYTFFNDKDEEVETLLNIEQTGKEQVSIELNDGLWVSMDFKPFKSFMRACAKNKNKWTGISPEELYYVQTKNKLSSSQVKLVHAFLEQNRRTTLVEKRSMQLIEDLEKRFSGRIKNITLKIRTRNGWDSDGSENLEWEGHPAMFIKGKQLDWLVYSRQHSQHRNGTQDVTTYCLISKENYTFNETESQYVSENENLPTMARVNSDKVFFWGPICIDQTNIDVSLGDQYAARALALLNDEASMRMVSTLRSYSSYKPHIRIDINGLSELSMH